MGAAAGHIPHIYENQDLTFAEILRIFQGLSSGQIPAYEKFDGQNLMISVKDGIITGARNKTQLKQPVALSYIPAMFAKYPHVQDVFESAIEQILMAFKQIDGSQLQRIFCNGSKFLNVEIISSKSKNVIEYNNPSVVMNTLCVVDTTGNILSVDPIAAVEFHSDNSDIFNKFDIHAPHIIKNNSISDCNIMGYKKMLSNYGIRDLSQPISSYNLKREDLENIILKMGNEMIMGLTSKLADPNIVRKDIAKRMRDFIQTLDPSLHSKALSHLQKIKFCGGLSYLPALEGIIFYYKNKPYKITGIFAPINQILGISKYSR